ncbi:MAG: EAL domain-containing protein [Spirochaetaceae bacterium]|nr:EAL domain-containing protein [Myxococcales bacterium]MCB9726049.1 EAL domain-containing protein [Spirochaetaceae bacterium]HPG25419.1 EAL domain-containing protein [Myxococcota bacterium]
MPPLASLVADWSVVGQLPASASVLAVALALVLLAHLRQARALRRVRSILRASAAAHAASGQGSLLVDRKGVVLAEIGPVRALLDSATDPKQPLALPGPIRGLLADETEQRRVLKTTSGRLLELSIAAEQGRQDKEGLRGIVVRDVTEQRKGERHLVKLAHYDSLTGLGNRRLFLTQLEAALAASVESGVRTALFYIDLDRFKEVNDSLGHGAGDRLLKTLATRFRKRFGAGANGASRGTVGIYRLAGDEFAIVTQFEGDVAEIESRARDLITLMAEPVTIGQRTIDSSGSVGIALHPEHASDVEDLVKHADAALYVAKEAGRDRFVIYDPEITREADRSRKVEEELRHAIERGELALHYQPKVEVEGETVVGFEALLRWYNRDLGYVGPSEFIRIAEERGLITEIGSWCVREACRQIRVWLDAGFDVVPVSVNVSSAQFRESEVERVVGDALVEFDVHPSMLEVELTESLLLADDDRTGHALRELRAIGVRIALDDFGTGYSALTYLNRFPLDVVKMDRGFLRDIEDSPAAAGIARAVVSLSHSLGFEVVAEGVDSPVQADLLRKMGCDLIQGFLFSPAIPVEEATRFLAAEGFPRPRIERIVEGSAASAGGAGVQSPAASASHAGRGARPDAKAPARILVIDDEWSSLGSDALRLMRLEADVHLVTGLDEARLFVQQEEPILDLLISSPSIDLAAVGEVLEQVRKLARDHVPRWLVIGDPPDAERREAVRTAGVDWVLWAPYADPELRFFVAAARTNRSWKVNRQTVRVPVDAIAWIRAGGQRATGVVTSLSRRGAFIETEDEFESGQPIRLEFKVESRRISVFANVTGIRRPADGDDDQAAGINVIFYEVDERSDGLIAEAIERIWMRFLP